jgi:hypothetical protein
MKIIFSFPLNEWQFINPVIIPGFSTSLSQGGGGAASNEFNTVSLFFKY